MRETIQYIERMKTQLGRKPKIFRSDRSLEYINEKLQGYLSKKGIDYQSTVGYCPEQNGIAERKNRTLMEAARTMLSDANLPKNHWAEAVRRANYLQNRIMTKATATTPYEEMYGEKPKWNDLKTFGSECYVMIPDEKRRKLDVKSHKLKFVGFDSQAKGYRLTNGRKITVNREVYFIDEKNNGNIEEVPVPDKKKSARKLRRERKVESRDKSPECVIFDVSDANQHQPAVPPAIYVELQQQEEQDSDDDFESAESDNENGDDGDDNDKPPMPPPVIPLPPPMPSPPPQLPRRSARENIGAAPRRYGSFDMTRAAKAEQSEPKSFKEAVSSKFAKEWKAAMDEEIKSINDNDTWELAA